MPLKTSSAENNKSPQTGFVTVQVKELYSIDIPDNLEKTSDLSTYASLQYRNLSKKLLVIVVDEEKSKITTLHGGITLAGYYDHVANQTAQKLDDAVIDKPATKVINSLNVLQGGINGKFLGTSLRYIIEAIESNTHFYQVICWTEERELMNTGNKIHKIINSFKEIK